MRFARLALDGAEGAILAHTLRLPGKVLKKGRRLTVEDLRALAAAGHREVMAALLEAGDLGEDEAAARIAAAVAGPGVAPAPASTGRCNLHARAAGLALVDAARVDQLNALDESVTVATVAPFAVAAAGDLVATVKIIPFAARGEVVEACAAVGACVRVAAFRPHQAGLVSTRLAEMPESQLEQASRSLGARLAAAGSVLAEELRCAHDERAVAEAIARLAAAGRAPILLLGASAIVDRHDVLPAALERAGGVVEHLGMPVDPGNLLMLGRLGAVPVVGVPGCARSLRPSGFDWVLQRLLAGIAVTPRDLQAMGVGGLLKDVPERPHPRSPRVDKRGARVAAVVLAAGLSRRMGENKLLVAVEGMPMVARVVDALAAAPLDEVVVVVGHEAARVRAAVEPLIGGRRVRFVECADYEAGLSASLRAGIASVMDRAVDGALVCLGDMPWISAAHVAALVDAFDPASGRAICVPFYAGKRGNPVLWAARYFAEMQALTGDVGAKELLERHAEAVWPVEMADAAVTLDIDTREALDALTGGKPHVA
jgi:molybdenum cofactor cytidylyltransferase